MTRHIHHLGTVPQLNAPENYRLNVSNGFSDPWLEVALVPVNISNTQAPNVPADVRRLLEESGASVDYVRWESDGKVHAVWKPDKTYNAVEYANIAFRIFAQAALGFGPDARLRMTRYRINNRVGAPVFVYPTQDPVGPSAPEVARRPLPTSMEREVGGSGQQPANKTWLWFGGLAAVGAVGLFLWMRRKR